MGNSLQALWSKVKSGLLDMLDRDKAILLLLGAIALFIKYRDVVLSILINSSKRLDKNAHKQDDKLETQETQLKDQANQLVQQAQQEPNKETQVTDDWYKSKK